MLTILGGLAEFERELILAHTSDGRTRAKARGSAAIRAHRTQSREKCLALAPGKALDAF
jgi:DNA invertase Pin-like site-specific DNA recombinase